MLLLLTKIKKIYIIKMYTRKGVGFNMSKMSKLRSAAIFALVFCLFAGMCAFAEDTAEKAPEKTASVYIFGDDWAYSWGGFAADFFDDTVKVVIAASCGARLSDADKTAAWGEVEKGDTVILSYGIFTKDRSGDRTEGYEALLDTRVKELKAKGADVIIVSICSSKLVNAFTHRFEETRNFYTEAQRTYTKKNDIPFVDLAQLTAAWANKTSERDIWNGEFSLTDHAGRLCAKFVTDEICVSGVFDEHRAGALSLIYDVLPGERNLIFDVSVEKEICDSFAVYVKGGKNVLVNSKKAQDGNSEMMTATSDGKITLTFSEAEKIQIAPVYEFDAGGVSTEEKPFDIEFTDGVYDIVVKKSEPLRASVYADGYCIASNLDMPGTEEVTECAEHVFRSFHIKNGKVSFTVSGKTDKLDKVAIREGAKIFDAQPRIFVGGDSTLCNYYPLLRTGDEADGTVMTGWAQMLHKYTPSEVINLAASGDWAENWLINTFPVVEKEGRPGDIFIVQFGINDHGHSTPEKMRASLEEMIDRTIEKGMIPIVVSPQISAGYGWGDASDIGKSDGGVYEEFFSCVRTLAEEKGCFYVDLTDLSAGWFSEIGREAVYKKYHIWDYEKNEPSDMMHLSAKGADAMCRFFVTAISGVKERAGTDNWGNHLDKLTLW